jgi:NADH dehydrogenase/NADH:ubiquinone oxidoreductase subunit G
MTTDRATVRVTLDGKVMEVPRGTLILEAARAANIDIPTLCWHPKVSIMGACRICLVEVEGLNRFIAACHTPVAEGMVVRTDTPGIRKVRSVMLELLLARHPRDCWACDKGGNCDLQRIGYAWGPNQDRFVVPPKEAAVPDRSPFVERDLAKCVMCRRCIRVCREVRGTTVLGAMQRGYHKKIATFFEQPLGSDFHDPFNCEFCGTCVDICPVGALTPKISKYRARPWEVKRAETSCPFCGVGCRAVAQYRKEGLVKTTPLPDQRGSFADLCFRGRFGTVYANHPSRLVAPMLRKDGALREVSWEDALAYLGHLAGGERLAAFLGCGATEEEAHAAASFARAVDPGAALLALDARGEVEEGPFPLLDETLAAGVADIAAAGCILLVGQDFTYHHPVAAIRVREARKAGGTVVAMDPLDTLLGRHATWWLRPPVAGLPALLSALAGALPGQEGEGALSDLAHRIPGAWSTDWPNILEALRTAPQVLVVLQKAPGGFHSQVRRAVSALVAALQGRARLAYLTPDADGFGVPLMIGASGAMSSQGNLDSLLGEVPTPPTALFLRTDPLGESHRSRDWQAYRKLCNRWIVCDSYLTPTAQAAELVLPLPVFTEQAGTLLASGGEGGFARLLPAPEGVREFGSVAGEVLARAGKAGPPPFEVATLRSRGLDFLQRTAPSLVATPVEEPPRAPEGGFLFSLRFHRFPGHRLKLVQARSIIGPHEHLEINPEDAARLALADGAPVTLALAGERFQFILRTSPRVPGGHLTAPFDADFPEVARLASHLAATRQPSGGLPATLERR